MTIAGTVRVRCPACQTEQEAELVQSINARTSLPLKVRLLEGKLNLLTCACGKRTQLAATLLYHDPDADYFCQACPGGEPAMVKGAEAFRAIGAAGTQRLVPSQNALMEKIKLLDAGLDDAEIAANRDGHSQDAKAEAALRFALRVVQARGHVTDAELSDVRHAGYNDAEIVEIVLHVALNSLTNYVNEVAGTAIDFPAVTARRAA